VHASIFACSKNHVDEPIGKTFDKIGRTSHDQRRRDEVGIHVKKSLPPFRGHLLVPVRPSHVRILVKLAPVESLAHKVRTTWPAAYP